MTEEKTEEWLDDYFKILNDPDAKAEQDKFYDDIDNITLIKNGLEHISFELLKENSLYYRVAKEAYTVLYRSMIEALKGSANSEVTGKRRKDKPRIYELGKEPPKTIKKEIVPGCKSAWRFSKPTLSSPPRITEERPLKDVLDRPGRDYLIGFFDALAMIQAENFMERYIHSKTSTVSDKDMIELEWLHENIRNDFEHFVPRTHLVSKKGLQDVSKICLVLSKELIFDSGNVIIHWINPKELKSLFDDLIDKF